MDDGLTNCVFLMIDSLRFDAVRGIDPRDDGYLEGEGLRENLETPSFDYLVDHGVTIPRMHAPFPATPPSTASVLTGLYPREHGICGFNRPLLNEVKTLPEYFSDAGYHTVLMNGIDVFSINGIGDRFDEYVFGSIRDLTRLVEDKNEEGTPVFAFFHTMDVHRPYFLSRYPVTPSVHEYALELLNNWSERADFNCPDTLSDTFRKPEEKLARYEGTGTKAWDAMFEIQHNIWGEVQLDDPVSMLADMYVKGVNWFDRSHLSRYVDFLESSGAGANTVTVLTGDHGETPREFGGSESFYHGGKPVEDVIQVPGIISHTDLDDHTMDDWDLTSLVDWTPTLLSLFNIDYEDDDLSGLNLLESPPEDRYVYSENAEQIESEDFPRDAVLHWHTAIGSDGYKYYRMGLPVEEDDFEREMEVFIEIMARKLCINTPKEELVEKWLSRAQDGDEQAVKQELVEELAGRCSIEDPELYHWQNDFLETDDLLGSEPREHQQLSNRMDKRLCGRFTDPGEIARNQEDTEVSPDKQEEVTQGLKGLGYL